MDSQVVEIIGLAASGVNSAVVVPIPLDLRAFDIQVSAKYVSAPSVVSGVQMDVTESVDGTTFTATGLPSAIAAPVSANKIGSANVSIPLAPAHKRVGHVAQYAKIILTNLDATRIVYVTVSTQAYS